MFVERYRRRLTAQRDAGLYRNPPEVTERAGKYLFMGGRKVLNFASNDYLGLTGSREVREKAAKNFRKYGTSSSSSRLVSGNYAIINRGKIPTLPTSATKTLSFTRVATRQTWGCSPLFLKGEIR